MIFKPTRHFGLSLLIGTGAILLALALSPCPVAADQEPVTNNRPAEKSTKAPTSGIGLFQTIISRADGDRCPMYPSCSHYAAQAVERHGRLKGWVLAAERLLRCGRDETRLAPTVIADGQRLAYDPLKANTFWWDRTQK